MGAPAPDDRTVQQPPTEVGPATGPTRMADDPPPAPAATVFGAIHCRVCITQDILGRAMAVRAQGNADADGDEDFVSVELKWRRQILLNPLR